MHYRFHHVGMISSDVAKAQQHYCDHFAHEAGPRASLPLLGEIQFLRSTGDVSLGLVSAPLHRLPVELARKGAGVAYLALTVDDIAEAVADLQGKGGRIAWEPQTTDLGESAGLYCGPYDLLFVLVKPTAELQAGLKPVGKVGNLRFHHTAVITHDLGGVIHMLKEFFGLRVLAEWIEHGTGEIKLVDSFYNDSDHYFLIEVLNPPRVAPSDQNVLDRRGTCFHHLSYLGDDVENDYKKLLANGVEPSEDYVFYEELGAGVSFIWDPDSNAVEVYSYADESVISPSLLA